MANERDTQAPETVNDEQEDAPAQAQTVADDARRRGTSTLDLQDSRKPRRKIPDGDEGEVDDLVDHMRQMERSGRIDMSAYRGEPNMDDQQDLYGKQAKLDKELPGES